MHASPMHQKNHVCNDNTCRLADSYTGFGLGFKDARPVQVRSPSVACGERSSSRAPALPATPRASFVLPVPGAP